MTILADGAQVAALYSFVVLLLEREVKRAPLPTEALSEIVARARKTVSIARTEANATNDEAEISHSMAFEAEMEGIIAALQERISR